MGRLRRRGERMKMPTPLQYMIEKKNRSEESKETG